MVSNSDKKTLEITLKEMIEKNTKKRFDNDEIAMFIMMAIEELCCIKIINKWIKYRILSFANTAIGINEKNCQRKSKFLKKAAVLRGKIPLLKIKGGDM